MCCIKRYNKGSGGFLVLEHALEFFHPALQLIDFRSVRLVRTEQSTHEIHRHLLRLAIGVEGRSQIPQEQLVLRLIGQRNQLAQDLERQAAVLAARLLHDDLRQDAARKVFPEVASTTWMSSPDRTI